MRQKVLINTTATDRELFQNLPLGDVWSDGEVIQVWAYLYRNSRLKIPDSWQETLSNFNRELMDIVGPPGPRIILIHGFWLRVFVGYKYIYKYNILI